LDYAMTQNNRGTVLGDLASLPDEDRRQRLMAALHAFDAALEHYRPDTAPLDYAMTQNNRGTVLGDLASLPDEDRRQRLMAALQAVWIAYSLFERLQHAVYAQIAQRALSGIRLDCGTDFDELWEAATHEPCPPWLKPNVEAPEMRQALLTFLTKPSLEAMRQALDDHPALLTEDVEPIFNGLFSQYKDNEKIMHVLTIMRQVLQDCREHGVDAVFAALARQQGNESRQNDSASDS
jgi:hypothetical protein